jgi:hypothetical protein
MDSGDMFLLLWVNEQEEIKYLARGKKLWEKDKK